MVSIAIPSTIIDSRSCKSLEQVTFALYQICRACVLFAVDEIVIYDVPNDEHDELQTGESGPAAPAVPKKIKLDGPEPEEKTSSLPESKPQELITTANMLQYLITPAHLRKLIFKPIGNLSQFRYAEKLPKTPGLLDSKHIIQGIAIPREKKKRLPRQKKLSKKDKRDARETTYVNLGFDRVFKLKDQTVPVNSQVFVDISKAATAEPPSANQAYRVRAVSHFSQVFTESALPDGYSQTLYIPCQHYKSQSNLPLIQEVKADSAPQQGLLLLFGHWNYVQRAVKSDTELAVEDASALFDGMLPGLERARIEDGVTITLSRL